jgi:DNA-binding response OmpR family regulator
LQRRGARILEANRLAQGAELAREYEPDVIVLDVDNDAEFRPTCEAFRSAVCDRQVPIVILGTVRRQAELLPGGEFVAKPYHYGPLVHKIEEMLARAG